MLSRTKRIDGFHLTLSRTEKELYEEFLKTEEAEILVEMQQYFAQPGQQPGGIRFDNKSLWSRIEHRVDVWFAGVCADRNQNGNLVSRSKEAILYRMKESAGQDDQGIARQEIREFKRSAIRQRKSDPRAPKRGRGEGGKK